MEFGQALRWRYPHAEQYPCIIEGQAFSPASVSIRRMNFGQHWRTAGIVEVDYKVLLPRELFLDLLRRDLPEYIEDCKQHPDPECGIDRALRVADWPSADDVLAQPKLTQFLAEWFAHDLLLHWLGDGAPEEEPGYVLNTIETVEVTDVITICGRGRTTDIPVRYQDV